MGAHPFPMIKNMLLAGSHMIAQEGNVVQDGHGAELVSRALVSSGPGAGAVVRLWAVGMFSGWAVSFF